MRKITFSEIRPDLLTILSANLTIRVSVKLPGNDAMDFDIVVVMISLAVSVSAPDLSICSDVATVITAAVVDDTGRLLPSADSVTFNVNSTTT